VILSGGLRRLFAALLLLLFNPARAEIVVSGVDGELLANVLAFVDLDDLDCAAERVRIESARLDAPAQAAEALNAFGYYQPRIRISIDYADDCWQAVIDIDTGEPVRLREVAIAIVGAPDDAPEFGAIVDGAGLVPGETLNHSSYERLKRQLQDLARGRGYAEARFEQSRIDVYPAELTADISLRFELGPRYGIGEISIVQDVLDDDFVNAFHDLVTGEPYDSRRLTAAFLDLTDSGYFEAVDVRTLPPDPATLTIPLRIELTPSPRRVISYGVGFSTDTGPRFRFGRSIRRFNQRGHQMSLDSQLSPVVSELTATYRMPIADPRFDWLNFSLGAKREDTETSLARSIEAGIRRVIDRPGGWSRTQFVSFIVEDFEVGTQTGRPQLLIPGVDWRRIRGDDALRPDRGSRLDFEVRGADESLLSDTGFVQATAAAKWIRSTSQRGRVLLRGRFGVMADDQFDHLPPSIRFFAGGDNSIRGFDFESLGPVDAEGAVIGGSRLFEASVEYEHRLKDRWSVAAFTDSGNAFDSAGLDMRTGAGIGARWRSPLGPVRIDVAWPVSDVEHGPRLHISLGPDL